MKPRHDLHWSTGLLPQAYIHGMTRDELRARMAREARPVRLNMRDAKPRPDDGPRLPMVRDAAPLGGSGQRLKATGALLVLIALVVGLPIAFDWFVDRYVPPLVKIFIVGIVVAFVVGCFVYIEITRRIGRPRILP